MIHLGLPSWILCNLRANLKPSEIAEMLRKEGVQGVVDICDNLTTLVSPRSTIGDISNPPLIRLFQ